MSPQVWPEPAGLDRAVALFRCLAHRTRLAICQELAQGERRVTDLATVLSLAQSTVSGHLAALRGCGAVNGRREGRQVIYSLAHREMVDLLVAAELVLARTGTGVDLSGTGQGVVRRTPLT